MPSNQANINIGVKYNVDQASVSAVKKSLQDLQNIKPTDFKGSINDLRQVQETAKQVEIALERAFNVNLGSLNVSSFNQQLHSAGLSVDQIYQQFSKLGAQGQVAFSRMASSVLTTNLQLKQTKSLITSMGETMANTVKWGIASSVMNTFTNSVQQAFQYAKSLDGALTDIRIVTGDSTEQMRQFAQEANKAAQNLGRSTMDYTKAALSFYQQGLSDEEVQTRTQTVLKAQNITGAGQEMADYLTAVWNGYKVANQEAELYVDKLAAVADSSASNMSQLAVAMSKVASTANAMGVPVDNLNAQIATIVATTRQAPESVGNALKTIYARINDIATGADDAQVSLGNYSKQMLDVGFSVLDANGNLRDTGDVIDEIGGKWNTLSREQQIYLARTMAGQRQYNNLIALFDNWSKYTDLVNVSLDAQGTTMEKNGRYMDSLGAKLEQLGAASERVKDALINEEDLKGLASFGTNILNILGNLIEGVGGGGNALLLLASSLTGIFSGTISNEINKIVTNIQDARKVALAFQQDLHNTDTMGKSAGYADPAVKAMVDAKKQLVGLYDSLSVEQLNSYNNLVKEVGQTENQVQLLKKKKQQAEEYANVLEAAAKRHIKQPVSLQEQIYRVQGRLESVKEALEGFKIIDISKDLKTNGASEKLNDLKNAVKYLQAEIGKTPEIEAFNKALEQIQKKGKMSESAVRQVKKAAEQLYNTNFNGTNLVAQQNEINQQYGLAVAKANQAKEAAENYLRTIQQFNNIQGIVNAISAVGRLSGALLSLSNIKNIWSNDSLSSGEKFLQTLTTISMTVPMVATSIRTLISTTKALLTTQKSVSAVQQLLTALEEKSIVVTKTKNALDAISNTSKKSQITLEQAQNIAKEAGIVLTGKETTVEEIKTAVTEAHTLALKQQTVVQNKLNLAMLANPYTLLIAGITALTVAIGIGLYSAYTKVERQAQKAKKQAQSAKKAYDDIKQSVSDLNSSFSNLASAREALQGLTKGTEQWNSALDDVNSQVLDLIQKFPELKDYITTFADGTLGFEEGAQQTVKSLYRDRQLTAGLAYSAAQARSTQANNNYLISEESRRLDGINGITPQELTQVVNAINTHGSSILKSEDTLKNALDKNTTLSKEELSTIIKESDAVNALAIEVKNNVQAAQKLSQTLISSALSGNEDYKNSQNKEVLSALISQSMKQAGLDQSKYYIAHPDYTQTGGVGIGAGIAMPAASYKTLNGKALAEAYQEYTGQTTTVDWLGRFKVNGERVEESVLKDVVAYHDALQQADKYIQQANQTISSWAPEITEIFSAFVGGITDISQLSLKDIETARTDKSLRETIAKQLGFETDEQIDKYFNDLTNSVKQNTNKYLSSLEPSIQEAFKKNFDVDSLDENTQKQIGQLLKNAFVEGKGVQGLEQGVAEVLADALNADKLDQLLSQDLSNLSLDEFSNVLKQLGIQTDISDQSLKAFLRTMKAISEEEQKTPEEIYKSVHDILDKKNGKTIDYGDQISAEQYDTLKQIIGDNAMSAFQIMADGSYKFLGDAEEFYNKANQASLQPFYNKIDELRSKLQELQAGTSLSAYQLANHNQYQQNERGGWDVNYDFVQKQVDALSAVQLISDEELAKYNNLIKNRQIDSNSLSQIKNKIQQNQETLQGYIEKQKESTQEQIKQAELQAAFAQQDLGQLISFRNREDNPLKEVLETGEQGVQKYIDALLSAADAEGLVRQNIEALAKNWVKNAKNIDWVNDSLEGNAQACYEVAAVAEDMVSGIQAIQKSWKETIKEGVQPSGEVLAETTQAVSDMFNQDVSSDFISQHLDEIRRVAEGDLTAVQQLGNQIAILNMQQVIVDAGLNTEDFNSQIQNFRSILASTNFDDIKVGTYIDQAPFYDALNAFIQASGATTDQINEILSGIGYIPNVQQVSVPLSQVVQSEDGTSYVARGVLADGTPFEQTVTGDFYSQNATASQITIPVIKGSKFARGAGNLGRIGGSRVTPKAPSSSGNKGGKGGNGGSSAKAKQPNIAKTQHTKLTEKPKEATYDPYQQTNKSLQIQNDLIEKLQKKEKQLTGKQRLKNLRQQINAIKDENKVLEKQLKISKDTTKENSTANLKKRLDNVFGQQYTVKYQVDGSLDQNQFDKINTQVYNDSLESAKKTFQQRQKEYNNYIQNVWNKYTAQQQEAHKAEKELKDNQYKTAQETYKEQTKAAEEHFKEAETLSKDYSEAFKDDRQREKEIAENTLKQIELQIEEFEGGIKLHLDVSDLRREWLDFEDKFINKIDDDDFFGKSKSAFNRISSYFDFDQLQATQDGLNAILKDIQTIQEGGTGQIYGKDLAAAQKGLEEFLAQNMQDLEEIQQLSDEIQQNYLKSLDAAKDKMDQQIDQYERINDLIEHNSKLVDLIYGDKAYDTIQKYYNLQKQNNQDQLRILTEQRAYWQNLMDTSEKNSEAWKKAKENVDDLTDSLNSKLEEMVDNLANQFQNRLNKTIEDVNNRLSGGRGLSYLDQQWDSINNYDDKFLDTFESKMGIDEITRFYQQAVDGLQGSPANQQKMNKLMNDQLKILKQKDHLTQYDLDRAKASLEVEKARMALEDNRYSKTKMRLRRDSQGNYTYQYVADEEKLTDLQAALADAQSNLYNMDKEHYRQTLNDMYDTYKEYLQKMRGLAEEYAKAQAANDEAEMKRIQDRMQLTANSYQKLWDGLDEDQKVTFNNLSNSFADGLGLDKAKFSAEEFVQIMQQNIPQVGTQVEKLITNISGMGGLIASTGDDIDQMVQKAIEYARQVEDTLKLGETSVATVMNATDANGHPLDTDIQKSEELLTNNTALVQSCKDQVAAMQTMLDKLNAFWDVNNAKFREWVDTLKEAQVVAESLYDIKDNNGVISTTVAVNTNSSNMNQGASIGSGRKIATFDTGGGTGTWGDSSGRLAFLHQKELVLNQDDTANILKAVEAVRIMTALFSGATSGELGSLASKTLGFVSNINSAGSLDQNVHIEANFPNVTQHNEIEQAFENLINTASMYASRYRD